MSKQKETLSMDTIVGLALTSRGAAILHRYMNEELDRSLGREPKDSPGKPYSPTGVDLPLWEAFKIFGPHTVSSFRAPIEEIEYLREELRLRKVERVLGCSVEDWMDDPVRESPDGPGHWWLDGHVVEVIENNEVLLVRLRNNQHRPVAKVTGAWGGPAIQDPRVVMRDEDEDIPF